MEGLSFWIWFNVFIFALLALDLGVINRKQHNITFKESLLWVGFWTLLALIFNVVIYFHSGPEPALEFLTAYVIEWSLSVDNLFVFIVIFGYFKVPTQYQYRVLFWGIIGALVLRGGFILAGVALFRRFEWMTFIFGAILLFTGIRMIVSKESNPSLEKNLLVRITKKFFRVSDEYDGKKFFTRKNGELYMTPLFLVLLVIDVTDLVFAVDSIPAVLAISKDAFIVYTSNIFAILGLRSLYFALAGMMELFRFLKYGLAIILTFVGIKMLGSHYMVIPTTDALIFVVTVLAISILLSVFTRTSAS